jgi:hypothetical protein
MTGRNIEAHLALRGLLRDHRLTEQVEARAAPFGRRFNLPEAKLLGLFLQRLQRLIGQGVRVMRQRLFGRHHALAHEAPRGILHLAEFVRQFPGAVAVACTHLCAP